MAQLEPQFQELLAHLVERVNKMLSQQGRVLPLGLLLRFTGKIDVSFGVGESAQDVGGMTKAVREALVRVVAGGAVNASCIAFPQENGDAVIALFETSDNYCATVSIPILMQPVRKLDTDRMQVDDGYVHVFPAAPA